MVPHKVDLRLVRDELYGGVDLDGGAVVDGGHAATIEGGGGGEDVEVERSGEERAFLELDRRIQDVRE